MTVGNFAIINPMSIRESSMALLACWEGVDASEATMAPLFEALRASIDASPTKPGDLPDVDLAMAGIGAMKCGFAITAEQIQAIVALAEIGFEQLEQFEIRWAADMRAIERWRAGDALPEQARFLLGKAKAEINQAKGVYAEQDLNDDYREAEKLAGQIEYLLQSGEPGNRALTMPDHADLVVWLMDGLDAPYVGPGVAEVDAIRQRLTAASKRVPSVIADDANAMLGRMADALRAMARRLHVVEHQAANSLPVLDLPDFLRASAEPHPATEEAGAI